MNASHFDADFALLSEFRSGHPSYAAVEKLLKRVEKWIWKNHSSMACHADDLAQETVLAVAKGISAFEGQNGAKFNTWVCAIAYRKVCSGARKAGVLKEIKAFEEETTASFSEDPEQIAFNNLVRDEALALMSERERTVFTKRLDKDLGFQEIADELGCSRPAAQQTMERALLKYRKYLCDEGLNAST